MKSNTIVGREQEIKLLEDALNSTRSELLAVYGRRRIGKTYLIRQSYQSNMVFELSGLHKGKMNDQLENFKNVLSTYYKPASKANPLQSWLEAFSLLEKYLNSIKTKKKKVIFIDEFPWIATSKSKFLMAFENFWNVYASKRKDLVVVICGSSASYMVQKIIRNKGGLHNRITQKIRLLPFTLYETERFLKSRHIQYSRYDILQLYMAIGGVPHYLDKLKKGESVAQALDRLCFSKDGILRTEFDDVFASLFDNDQLHTNIIQALGKINKGATRNQLLKETKINSGGSFTKAISELIESGFVTSYLPYKANIKQTTYRLSDEFCMFYLKFMKDNKGSGTGTWLKLFNSQKYVSWSGFSYETICLKHIPQIKSALGISAIYTEQSGWISRSRNNAAQIDLLIDRADNIINICEIKFSNNKFTINKSYADNLMNKISAFRNETKIRKSVFLTLITTYGINENSYSLQMVQKNIDMNVLFSIN